MDGRSIDRGNVAEAIRAQSCARDVWEVILHHTYSPTAAQYRGESTIQGIWRYHTEDRGWSDIGYHYIVSPDGLCWFGRPLRRSGAHVLNHNRGTIGVSMILNGDEEVPSDEQRRTTAEVLRVCLERFGLDAARNFGPGRGFHRDYADKSCPGTRITKGLVLGWLDAAPTDGDEADADEDPDVSPWAESSVGLAADLGILRGRTDGLMHGREPVTREEAAIMCLRAAAVARAELTEEQDVLLRAYL